MNNKMKIDVLISTMNIKSIKEHNDLINKMNINGSSITINQCPDTNVDLVVDECMNKKNKIISFNEKGLSLSRNRAIEKSNSDICVIADDDLVYKSDYKNTILKAYEKYPDADIITFKVENVKVNSKLKESKLKKYQCQKICSVQLTFKRSSIVNNKIKFDQNYGAGSGKFIMGEENIFLSDCINSNLKIIYVPDTIAKLNDGDSTWFKGYDSEYFISKGACFKRMYKKTYLIYILQFAIRKIKKYKNQINFFNAIRYMIYGSKVKTND